jgi:hypothetical protein
MSTLNREKLNRKHLANTRLRHPDSAEQGLFRLYGSAERDPPPRLNLRDSRGRPISLPRVSMEKAEKKKGPKA